MSKILKTKKINVFIAYNSLRTAPPKEFPSIKEMELTMDDILPALEEQCKEFEGFREKITAIREKHTSGEMTEEDANKELSALSKEQNVKLNEHGSNEVEVEMENEPFNTFFQQFERWGKNWFSSLEDFMAFRTAMNEANSQSKEKEKKEGK